MRNVRESNGITLIALVITIIVLLILAGVTIVAISGENGILQRAVEAKEKTEQAKDIEKIRLAILEAQIGENSYQKINQNSLQEAINNQFEGRNVVVSDNGDETLTVSCLDTLIDYIISGNSIEKGIDWNEAMANAVSPASQDEARNEGVIGIGTNGQPIDMDLWEYTFDESTNGYGLNDSISLSTTASAEASKGYLGSDFENIIIPQYISKDNGKNWIAVTNLDWVFYNCSELININKLPLTVKSVEFMFRECIQLSSVPELPNSIETLHGTFYNCKNLKTFNKTIPLKTSDMTATFTGCNNLSKFESVIPDNVVNMHFTFSSTGLVEFTSSIPNSVENMQGTFRNCTQLSKFDTTIPENVTNMQETFYKCDLLENINISIPQSVTNFYNTFRECSKLSGIIEINANLTGNIMENGRKDYEYCFYYSAIQSKGLTVKCSEKVYNLFYDESTKNKLNNLICEENSNIKMYKV